MNKPANGRDRGRPDVVATRDDRGEFAAKPSLYASVVETESRLRQVSLSRLGPKPVATRVRRKGVWVRESSHLWCVLLLSVQTVTREVNFPPTQEVYDYGNMVDVGPNSGTAAVAKPKPREFRSTKKPEPKLSDYYRPDFDNAQRIQMDCVHTHPELTVQYDGLAVTRLLNEIDGLVFK